MVRESTRLGRLVVPLPYYTSQLLRHCSYADNFFKKKIKKFITDLAGLCEARIMVWTIRDTLEGKEKLVSMCVTSPTLVNKILK